jgi:Cu/Ag efflux pump CusA
MSWLVLAIMRWGKIILAATVAAVVLGIGALRAATFEAYPEFTPTAVQVQTEALGLSAAEVESLVTVPLEQDLLNGVPWLDHISSTSTPGLSAIDIVFQAGTDPLNARQMVQERMTQIRALPNVGTPPIMVQPLAALSRVAMLGLTSADRSTRGLVDLSFRARWTIKSRLMGVPGVANVIIYGQRDRQLQVQVDPARMSKHATTLTDVISTAGNALWVSPLSYLEANTPGTGGFIESPNQRLAIQHILPISTSGDLAKVALTGDHAGHARLSDVAKVVVDHQPLIGDALTAGEPGVVLVVEKFPGASTRQVTAGVEAAMAELSPGLSGIHVDTHLYRPATYLNSSLRNLGVAGAIGAGLLLAALALVFSSWRKAAVVLVAVSTSLVGAALVLNLRGTGFTYLTLAGFAAAVGVVVDGAVGDVSAVSIPDVGPGGKASLPIRISEALVRSRRTAVYAVLITVLVGVPAAFLSPFARSFSRPFLTSFALALGVSFVVALTLTPILAGVLLRGASATKPSPVVRWLQPGVSRALSAVLDRARYAAIGGALLAVALIVLAPQLGRGPVLPALREPDVLVRLKALPGTALPEMDRITNAAAGELRALPGVADVGVHVGRAIAADQTSDVNTSEVWVTLDAAADIAATKAAVANVVHGYPGLASEVNTYSDDQLAAWTPAKAKAVTVRVFAKDDASLRTGSNAVISAVAGVAGVSSASAERVPVQPSVEVAVNLPAARRVGLGPGDVRRTVTTMMSGLLVGNLYEQQAVFDVVVRGPIAVNNSLTALSNIRIDTPSGRQVRLQDVATVTLKPEPSVIRHEAIARSLDVTVSVSGRDPAAVAADVSAKVAALSLPAEARLAVLPVAGGALGTGWTFPALVVGALVAAFLLLQAATGSWRLSAGLLVLVPLAATGGLVGAAATGGARSIGVLAGLLSLFGIVLSQALTLVHGYRDAGAEPGLAPRTVIETVTQRRVVPILLTALATAAVLVPALILGDQAGLEILRPLAATVLAGLLTAVPVLLFGVPSLYLKITGVLSSISGRPSAAQATLQAERSGS